MDSDGPVLLETSGALNVLYRGRLLYSERGPASLPARLALSCETGPGRLYILPSPCLWYGIAELLARIEEGSALLCLEAEPALAGLARESLPRELEADTRLHFLDSAEPERLCDAIARIGHYRVCVSLRLSGGGAFHARAYAAAEAFLNAEFSEYWRSKAALLVMGRLWTRNIFRNLSRMDEISPRPLPRFDSPVIVCGAGPSLEAAFPLIEAKRSKLALIACDTALGPLLARGLKPDLVVCLEGQAHNLPDFTCLGDGEVDILADLSSHPGTFSAPRGAKFLTSVAIVESPFLGRVRALGLPCLACPPLGSVGVHAAYLASRLSRGPILLTGLDFAFESGKTHARGSPSLQAELGRMTRLSRWGSQTASAFRPGLRAEAGLLTDPVLSNYARLLSGYIEGSGLPFLDIRGPGPGPRRAKNGLGGGRGPPGWPGGEGGRGRIVGPEAGRRSRPRPNRGDFSFEGNRGSQGYLRGDEGKKPLDEGRTPRSGAGSRLPSLGPARFRAASREGPQDLLNRVLIEVEYWLWKLEEIAAAMEEGLAR